MAVTYSPMQGRFAVWMRVEEHEEAEYLVVGGALGLGEVRVVLHVLARFISSGIQKLFIAWRYQSADPG